uniref:Uncharacterized protein n=1 Tax=Chenopodium quinoa TaxID=63459 RepID=A0A803MHZ7_CHEQI
MSESDVVQTVSRNPKILQQRLGPTIHALKTVLGSDENVVTFLKRSVRDSSRFFDVLVWCLFTGFLTSAVALSEAVFLKRFVLPFEEVHQVYAQLTGSTVESLNVGRCKSQS